jgi:hypothetical protein
MRTQLKENKGFKILKACTALHCTPLLCCSDGFEHMEENYEAVCLSLAVWTDTVVKEGKVNDWVPFLIIQLDRCNYRY